MDKSGEPPSLAMVKNHSTRPEEDSFFAIDAPGVVLTGVKRSEEGDELILRLSETYGEEKVVNVRLPVDISRARRLNIIELPLENETVQVTSDKSVQVRIKPHEIVTLGLKTNR